MNAITLKAEIERLYVCVDGPGKAFFELPLQKRSGVPARFELREESDVLRIVYETVAVAMVGETDVTEAVLCGWVRNKLHALLTKEEREDAVFVLFWRRHPSVNEFPDAQGRICTMLRLRLAIPGLDLSEMATPEGEPCRWL